MLRAAARSVIVSRCVRGIDGRGLHNTNLEALRTALLGVARDGSVCLVDGFNVPEFGFEQRAVIDGDCRSAAIAAASVLAKVSRDRYMRTAAARHPELGLRDERRLLDPRAPRGDRRSTASRRCTGSRSSRSPTTSWRSKADRRAPEGDRRPCAAQKAPSRWSMRSSRPRVELDPDGVEAQLGAPAAGRGTAARQPLARHQPQPPPLARCRSTSNGPSSPRSAAPGDDLVLTSQNTRQRASAATMSSSPWRVRKLASSTVAARLEVTAREPLAVAPSARRGSGMAATLRRSVDRGRRL